MNEQATNRYIKLIRILAGALVPFVVCGIYCLIRGFSPLDFFVPNSINNDSVYYYKMVDGVLAGGIPRGYMGYNESHALIGTFGAWSPIIITHWVLWGFVFGWGYSSAIWCNLVLISLAFALFVALTDMDLLHLALVTVALAAFPSFSIHVMSLLPETAVLVALMIYMGCAINYCKGNEKKIHIGIMYFLGFWLTLIRPFMALLALLPTYFVFKRKGKKAIWLFFVLPIVELALYFAFAHFLTAEYFLPMFSFEFAEKMLHGKFVEGLWILIYQVRGNLNSICGYVKDAFSFGMTMGTQYFISALTALILLILAFFKTEKEKRPIYLTIGITAWAVIGSIIMFTKWADDGGRHTWAFAVCGILLLLGFRHNIFGKVTCGVTGLTLIAFIIVGSMVPTDYDVPVVNAEKASSVEYWGELARSGAIEMSDDIGYDNTIIWAFIDYYDDRQIVMDFSGLYAVPAESGISCCFPDYIIANFDNLKSRYIMADSRGKIAALCAEKGLKVVGEHENVIMYQRY